jgi:hypothetical protein
LRYVHLELAPGPGEPGRLPEHAPYCFAPSSSAPLVLAPSRFPRDLPWALKPSALKGCVGTLKNGYLRKVPLPQVPRDQSIIPVACTATYTVNPQATGYLPDPRIPLYNNLKRLLLDVSKLAFAPSSLCRLM